MRPKNKNYGCSVDLRYKSGTRSILRNVTEIHYNYPSLAESVLGPQVAFESNIHTTGITVRIEDVSQFETTLETEKQSAF